MLVVVGRRGGRGNHVAGEEAPKRPDRSLEDGDVLVLVEHPAFASSPPSRRVEVAETLSPRRGKNWRCRR